MSTIEKAVAESATTHGLPAEDVADALALHVDAATREAIATRQAAPHLRQVTAAHDARTAAEASWRSAIVEAALAGVARDRIAAAGRVTPQRVGQIVRAHRDGAIR